MDLPRGYWRFFETFDRLAPSVTEGFIIGANRLPIEISPIHLTARHDVTSSPTSPMSFERGLWPSRATRRAESWSAWRGADAARSPELRKNILARGWS